MLGVLMGLLKTVGVNLVGMFVGPKMIVWLLRQTVKATSNDIDDNVADIVEGAFNKDTAMVKSGVSALFAGFRKKK